MPDREDDLNPFADALARLAPQPPTLSRDALLFAAGQAAAGPKTPAWVWPSAAAFFACLSVVLAGFLLTPGPGPGTAEVRYVTQYVPMPAREADAPGPPSVDPEEAVHTDRKVAEVPDDSIRMMRVRRDVFRWGVDMLPRSTAPGPGPTATVSAGDLDRWLNLPPGTFAAPPVRKTGPKAGKDDDDDK